MAEVTAGLDASSTEAPRPTRALAVVTPLPVKPRGVHLKSLSQVRREMASVYSQVRRGELDSQEGSRRTYILGQIGRVLEVESIETRIARLEKQQQLGGRRDG